jgi:hypothetical protein
MTKTTTATQRFHNVNTTVPGQLTDLIISSVNALPDYSEKYLHLKKHFLTKFVTTNSEGLASRQEKAIAKWLNQEEINRETNVRIKHLPLAYHILPGVTFNAFISFSQRLVLDIVGASPYLDDFIGEFSGGASTSKGRSNSHPAIKMTDKAHITRSALPLWNALVPMMPGWSPLPDILETNGNVLFTVPKNADIERCACKEPDLNMFMQKGLGNKIRTKLKRKANINLNDQNVNKQLARIGSIDDSLSTLDLSSASDSVTTELVRLLLPHNWFVALDSVRSHYTDVEGIIHRNEMFSSMGNGFTFELESLIFYALTRTTAYFRGVSGVISIYGDDIICPSKIAHDLIFVLKLFGFSTNNDKSFINGPFRESCGGHFYNGFDVTPFFLKRPIKTLTDLIHIMNRIRYWSVINEIYHDDCLEVLWNMLKLHVPEKLWGGYDLSFDFALVTSDSPRFYLKPMKKVVQTEIGGYLLWLCYTRNRNSNSSVQTSSRSIEKQVFRYGRLRQVNAGLGTLYTKYKVTEPLST